MNFDLAARLKEAGLMGKNYMVPVFKFVHEYLSQRDQQKLDIFIQKEWKVHHLKQLNNL